MVYILDEYVFCHCGMLQMEKGFEISENSCLIEICGKIHGTLECNKCHRKYVIYANVLKNK
jgi:hypothetical protein